MSGQVRIRIVRCSEKLRWYAEHIGEDFPVIRRDLDGYWTFEPDGYVNVVLPQDVEVI